MWVRSARMDSLANACTTDLELQASTDLDKKCTPKPIFETVCFSRWHRATMQRVEAEALAAGQVLLIKIRTQIDMAANLYIAYASITLMLGTPLDLFRPPIWAQARQRLAMVGQKIFVLVVVAGMEFVVVRFVEIGFDFELYWSILLTDPCLQKPDFVGVIIGKKTIDETGELVEALKKAAGALTGRCNRTQLMSQYSLPKPAGNTSGRALLLTLALAWHCFVDPFARHKGRVLLTPTVGGDTSETGHEALKRFVKEFRAYQRKTMPEDGVHVSSTEHIETFLRLQALVPFALLSTTTWFALALARGALSEGLFLADATSSSELHVQAGSEAETSHRLGSALLLFLLLAPCVCLLAWLQSPPIMRWLELVDTALNARSSSYGREARDKLAVAMEEARGAVAKASKSASGALSQLPTLWTGAAARRYVRTALITRARVIDN
ncbi:hypothetical protein T492DRAFT_841426 [Pavlovales sp. CCMP2436]|nr:hypothetical protein T492DRAFT_841426 [Pavlovales sp. CCMP2436]